MFSNFVKAGDTEESQFEIDSEEKEFDLTMNMEEKLAGRNSLFRLEQSVEEEAENEGNVLPLKIDEYPCPLQHRAPSLSKLSLSLKNISIGEKSWRHEGTMQNSSYLAGTSSGNRSVNEQLPASTSFVKVADMNEEEWLQYLEHFQKLLYPAFTNHKFVTLGQRQKQRLGTSCQF